MIQARQRCTRCIMPDTIPGVEFDENGVCTLCRNWVSAKLAGEAALRDIVTQARGTAAPYDCVVPLSGGRDSTYVLYLAKRVWGLSPLAVNFDNEFRNPQAVTNMERACAALGVELKVVSLKNHVAAKIASNSVRASIAMGIHRGFSSLCRACTIGYLSAPRREAERLRIPLILWGNSHAESAGWRSKPAARRRSWDRLRCIHSYREEYYAFIERSRLHVRGNHILSRGPQVLKNPRIREVSVFDYIEWNRDKIKSTIMSELGWRKPEGHVSTWRTDCFLHQLENFSFVRREGRSKDCAGYCNMINAGQMSRDEALAQEEATIAGCANGIEDILINRLGLSRSEADRILNM